MTHVYYKEAAAAIIVFDLTRPKTWQAVVKWKEDVSSKVHLENGEPVPTLLLGNKCDLAERAVSRKEVEDFVKKHNFTGYFEISAKTNENVDRAMQLLIRVMLDPASPAPKADALGFKLTDSSSGKDLERKCC
eukprot:TRINITY_DN4284_c0_g1_i2.p1 TRINITY_DN4284_c0_g1~~TRINITY_DN4284_c0_g1_i2.p1  ORF type:complete len:154 (-),score=1.73 TRINITY_DN4284_c0_g1_i2:312-710(-)